MLLGVTACEQGPPPPDPQANKTPPPPPPPPPPKVTPIKDLMAELNIDPRIVMDENAAPNSDAERRAVLTFLDAVTRGNATAVRDMLSMDDQLILEQLIDSGRWDSTVQDIDSVMVMTGPNTNRTDIGSSTANLAVLAIFTVNNEFQPTMWYLEDDVFAAGPTPPDIDRRFSAATLRGLIDSWHQIVDEERAEGQRLEVDISLPQQILEQRERGGEIPDDPTPPGLPSPGGPGGPGAPPGDSPGPGVPL